MPINFNVAHYNYSLPWFMFDLSNFQIITSVTVPGDISDSKDVLLTETPIPGLNFAPVQPSGNGNRKVSFTLPLIKRNNTIGNSLLIKQFQILRNQATGLRNLFPSQFTANPKVLYYWGTGSVPLVWFVKKCDLTNKQLWVNQQGQPQFSEVSIELWLDENHVLYKAEEIYRKASSLVGGVLSSYDVIDNPVSGRAF